MWPESVGECVWMGEWMRTCPWVWLVCGHGCQTVCEVVVCVWSLGMGACKDVYVCVSGWRGDGVELCDSVVSSRFLPV